MKRGKVLDEVLNHKQTQISVEFIWEVSGPQEDLHFIVAPWNASAKLLASLRRNLEYRYIPTLEV
jgi:hypothetical protein